MNKKITLIFTLVIFYLVGLGAGYALTPTQTSDLVSPTVTETPTAGKPLVQIDPGEPRDQACPLNGIPYTATERNLWEKRRPMAIMIENHHESRPQSGLNSADIVYESVAEGGITRFMAVFYCGIAAQDLNVGPVRSARTYYLDWASEYGKFPLYVHVGGANTPNKANALGQIKDYGWLGANDLSQFGLSVKECWRDDSILKKATGAQSIPTEHTMQCSTQRLYDVATKRGFTNLDPKGDSWTKYFTPWKFTSSIEGLVGKPASSLAFDFWKDYTQYNVAWKYDTQSKTYLRENSGTAHLDYSTGKQLSATTVILLYTTETGPIDAEKHMIYGTIGTGTATVFTQGMAYEVTWSKKSRLDRLTFKDAKGKEFQFLPGRIWIENLAKGNKTVVFN